MLLHLPALRARFLTRAIIAARSAVGSGAMSMRAVHSLTVARQSTGAWAAACTRTAVFRASLRRAPATVPTSFNAAWVHQPIWGPASMSVRSASTQTSAAAAAEGALRDAGPRAVPQDVTVSSTALHCPLCLRDSIFVAHDEGGW